MNNSLLSGYGTVRFFNKETNEEVVMKNVSINASGVTSGMVTNASKITWDRGFSGTLTNVKINYDNELMRPLKIHRDLKLLREALKYVKHYKKKQRIIKRISALSSELVKIQI